MLSHHFRTQFPWDRTLFTQVVPEARLSWLHSYITWMHVLTYICLFVAAFLHLASSPLAYLQHETFVCILSYEHFYPDTVGKPPCTRCNKNTNVTRDGFVSQPKRCLTIGSYKLLVLSAEYRCNNCPGVCFEKPPCRAPVYLVLAKH